MERRQCRREIEMVMVEGDGVGGRQCRKKTVWEGDGEDSVEERWWTVQKGDSMGGR